MNLTLKNPHSVLAVLQTRPQDVVQVSASNKSITDAWESVVRLCHQHKIPVSSGQSKKLPGGRRGDIVDESTRASSFEAVIKEKQPISIEDLFYEAPQKKGGKGLWLALDSLQDPHNVGAIFRSAAFFGVQGILLTQERSAPLSSIAYDVASGGMEHVPFTIQTSLQRGLEHAKEAGLWILGSSEHSSDSYLSVQKDRPWLLVLGNEEKGMRRLTEETCDVLCGIPQLGKVGSLNVSVAAGVLISHLAS